MFIAPNGNPDEHRSWVETPMVDLLTVAVKNYEEAAELAKKLMDEGIQAIELCGGFGNKGTAIVTQSVEGKIPVGVVRFDIHPGLGGKSGDSLFMA